MSMMPEGEGGAPKDPEELEMGALKAARPGFLSAV